jgi:Flp pilus assembly pilin Flp
MRALIERFVRGDSGVTAYGLTAAAALMLIGVGAWVVAPAPVLSLRRRSIH